MTLVAVFASSFMANAQEKCSVAANVGTYAVKCNGYLTPGPNAPMVPATGLSKAVADKDGNWSGSGTLSLGGAIVTQNVQSVGPAMVNPDCTGSLTYSQTINGQPRPTFTLTSSWKRTAMSLMGSVLIPAASSLAH